MPTFDMRVGFDKIFQSGPPAGSFALLNNAMYDNSALASNNIELLRGKFVQVLEMYFRDVRRNNQSLVCGKHIDD